MTGGAAFVSNETSIPTTGISIGGDGSDGGGLSEAGSITLSQTTGSRGSNTATRSLRPRASSNLGLVGFKQDGIKLDTSFNLETRPPYPGRSADRRVLKLALRLPSSAVLSVFSAHVAVSSGKTDVGDFSRKRFGRQGRSVLLRGDFAVPFRAGTAVTADEVEERITVTDGAVAQHHDPLSPPSIPSCSSTLRA